MLKLAVKPFVRAEALLIAGTVLFAVFCFSSINKPLTTDEVEFAGAGLAIARTGKPIYYMGDTPERYCPTKDLWQAREAPQPGFKYGLWHAPLYIGVLALSLKIFGMSNWAARLPGVACILATLWLLRSIVKLLFPMEKAKSVFNVAAFLYLINPLILQQGLMLDIDNTVVTVTSVLFLHEFLRLEHRQIAWLPKYAWLSLLIALTFWAKEFAGLFVGTALLVYVVGNRRWRDAVGVVLMLLAGMALFWGSWWLYCRLSGMPVMYFIRDAILGKLAIGEELFTTTAKQTGLRSALFFVVFGCLHTTLWVSIFYAALFLVALGWRVKTVWQTKRLAPLDLLMLYVLVILAVTQGYRPSFWFLKYEYPAFGVLLVPVAAYLCEKLSALSRGELYFAGVVALILAAAQVILIQDPLLTFFHAGLKALRDKNNANTAMFYAITTVVILVIVWLSRAKWPFSKVCAGTMVIGLVGVNLGIDWKQRASYTTSISWNNYGEKGFAETVAYLKSVLRSNDVPICRKDFGFYLCKDASPAKHSWFNPAVITDTKTRDDLVQNITAPGVSYIVVDPYLGYYTRPDAVQIIQEFYKLDKQIGSYRIHRLKQDSAEAHYNLGVASEQAGRVQDAIGHYEQALRLNPDYADAQYNLGCDLARLSRVQEAMEHWEQALRIKPDYALAHNNLGVALWQAGKPQEAIGHYEQALRIKPDSAEAHNNLGLALWQAGKPQDAIGHYEQALRLKPDYAAAHYSLGVALEQAGRIREAIEHYQQALRINPDYTEAQNKLVRLRAVQ